MGRRKETHCTSFEEARDRLNGRERLKLGNNAWLESRFGSLRFSQPGPGLKSIDAYAVRVYDTDVVTYLANGNVELNTGGWKTNLTKAWISAYLPRSRWPKKLPGFRWTLRVVDYTWLVVCERIDNVPGDKGWLTTRLTIVKQYAFSGARFDRLTLVKSRTVGGFRLGRD